MNNLMIFEGKQVEVFEFNEKILFNPYDCGKCLELTESGVKTALSKMNDKQVIKLTNLEVAKYNFRKLNNRGENFLTESGVYKLIFKSQKEEAERFQDWVADEVLPSIRQTGTYNSRKTKDTKDESEIKYMNAQARLKNARAREAKIYLEIAENVDIKEYKQIMYSKATEQLYGEALIPLPVAKKTYSATEIGKILGVSANKVGSLANAYNLKTDEYGIKVWDKAKHSNKQVTTFRYYENVIPIIKKALSSFDN
ncbi:BRO family protein [Clostridioides difficile]|uniref:BRO-N domain-containing protein n=1 Tax=Clostridioides difficile TaxID=1496 RepID=UPI0008A1590E|nr:BRO family protein [Clostridioides difficile]OFU29819.1 hypothetical protein HMPREF3075_11290 [Clostridium sp. HMSC19B11]MCE4686795.1 phage antirepressor protein [Clostridioides difficile]MCH7328040.1 phage antirepressor protein [Clostridioides difficile]MCI4688719.1 phage antirepressor protein [Clostridioides difficile]MCJ1757516.1 phage antirepressor protein [Clostridioides difficile]